MKTLVRSQSLFYWITYSYNILEGNQEGLNERGLNPYFIGLPILIYAAVEEQVTWEEVSILILLDYLFL